MRRGSNTPNALVPKGIRELGLRGMSSLRPESGHSSAALPGGGDLTVRVASPARRYSDGPGPSGLGPKPPSGTVVDPASRRTTELHVAWNRSGNACIVSPGHDAPPQQCVVASPQPVGTAAGWGRSHHAASLDLPMEHKFSWVARKQKYQLLSLVT
jgi:hypothetical protein